MTDLLSAAKALLDRIDNMTSEEFALGGERSQREALRAAIAEAEMPVGSKIRMPDRDTVYTVDGIYFFNGEAHVLASYQHAPNQRVVLGKPFSAVIRVPT